MGGKVVDLPVTFTARIKSSGYGDTKAVACLRRGSTGFIGAAGVGGAGGRGRGAGAKGAGRGAGLGASLPSYPLGCGPLTTRQDRNDAQATLAHLL